MNHLGPQLVEEIVCAYESPEALQSKTFRAYNLLRESGPEAMAAFVRSGGIEALVTAVEAFKDFSIAVHNAVALISYIASGSSEAAARFGECGGIAIMANWLHFYLHSAPSMCTDLCIMASLMLLEPSHKAAFTRAGGVCALLDILRISKTKEALTSTLNALLSYTHMSDECSKAISSYPDAEGLFCRTLSFLVAEPALFGNVVVLLYRYTNACMEANKRLCNSGAISVVISAMELNYGDRRLRRTCLALLGNLSFYLPGADMITLAGGVRLFLRILRDCRMVGEEEAAAAAAGEETVQDVRSVLSVLYSVLMDSRVGMDYSFENGLCEGVVDLLTRYNTDLFVNHYSFGVMSNILMVTEYSKILESDKSLMCDAVVVYAIRALNTFKGEIALQNRAIGFIANAAVCDNFPGVIIRESGHLALAEALKRNRSSKAATLNCMRAIGNLTGDSEELTAYILEVGVVDTVRSILREKALGSGDTGDVECAERCLRTLELFLSYESLHSKFATPELLADVAAVAARYPDSLSVGKSSRSIARKINPEVVQALESGLCTNVCVPRCEEMCPFNEGHYYCPKCCTPQLTYCCKTCSERHEKNSKFCVTCWKHHPRNHVSQCMFLSRRCQCDCYLK